MWIVIHYFLNIILFKDFHNAIMFSLNIFVPNFEFYLKLHIELEHFKKITSNYLGWLYGKVLLNSCHLKNSVETIISL